MAITIRTKKKGAGFIGYIVCTLRGQRIWSEKSSIVRTTREDARSDARWLREQQLTAQQDSL